MMMISNKALCDIILLGTCSTYKTDRQSMVLESTRIAFYKIVIFVITSKINLGYSLGKGLRARCYISFPATSVPTY